MPDQRGSSDSDLRDVSHRHLALLRLEVQPMRSGSETMHERTVPIQLEIGHGAMQHKRKRKGSGVYNVFEHRALWFAAGVDPHHRPAYTVEAKTFTLPIAAVHHQGETP